MRFDQFSESGEVVFLFSQEWCTGKTEIAGIGKHLAHPGGKRTELGTVALINEHEDIGRLVPILVDGIGLVELVNERRNNA